jgi:hypothetical protein
MLGKLIKAAISVALLQTGLQWLTGTGVFSPSHIGSIWHRAFWRQKVAGNLAMFGLAYLSAKGSEDTTRQNLAIKSAGLNAIAARNIVYGKTRVGGTVVFRGTSGANNYQLHNVIALAGHEINDLKKIFIDAGSGLVELDLSSDFASTTENSETVYRVTESAFVNTDNDNAYTSGSLIKVTIEKGDQTTSNGFAVANIGSSWTTDHKLQGIAYVYISCVFDVEKFTRYPEFSFEIEGKKVVDPRVHATNRTFSSNPALIIRDYLKDSTYGFGATDTEISDETSGAGFKQAANDCDDDITTTGSDTEDRFTLNGEFGSTEEPQRVLEHMLSSCGGQLNYNNGQFSLFVGKGRTAAGSITDDKVLAPVQITTKSSGMGSANGVKATYVRPSDNYIGGEITPYKDSTFLTEDTPSGESSPNYEKFLNLSFPYTHTTYTAQRLARMALNYGRQDQTLSVVVPIEFLSYQVGDVVNFTNERLGYDGKDFEITGMSFEFMNDKYLAVRLDLKEYNSAVFNTFTYVADPSLPTAPTAGDTSVAPPTSLTLTEFVKTGSVIKSADVYVKANWTNAVDEKIVKTVVMYKRSTDSNFDAVDVGYPINHFHIKADTGTTYDVKVLHTSVAGISSAETAVVQLTVGAEVVTLNTGTIGGITIAADKLYEGTGTFNNSNTGFYLDDDGQFSLKDKLSFNGTTLAISGNLTVENTIDAGKITLDGQDLSTLLSASGSGTTGTLTSNTKKTLFNYTDPLGNLIYGLYVDTVNSSLGIGTLTDPSSALHIRHTTPHIRLEDTDTNEYVRIKGDSGNMILEVDLPESDANSYLGIDIDNGERARFTSTGLGIGTTSPDAPFHVANSGFTCARFERPSVSGGGIVIQLKNGDGNIWNIGHGGSEEFGIYNGSTFAEQFCILTDGKVGIGTNSPSDLLEISQATDGATIRISSTQNNSSHSQTTPFGSLEFYSGDASGGGAGIRGAIKCYPTASSGAASDLAFTLSDGSTNDTEVARFTQEGYLGIGTTSPSEKLNVNGNIRVGSTDKLYFGGTTNYVSGSHGSNYLHFFTNNSERVRIDSSGNIGIGTTSPAHKIHIASGSTNVGIQTISTDAGAYMGFEDNTTGNTGSNSNVFVGANGDNFLVFTGATERMRITSSGEVNINQSGLVIEHASTPFIQLKDTTQNASLKFYAQDSNAFVGTTSSHNLMIGTNNTEAIRINNSQNVGIGTSSPTTANLHVKDNGQILRLESTSATGNAYISYYDSSALKGHIGYTGSGDDDFNIYNGESSNFKLFTSGSERLRVNSSGNVGIGTTSPVSGQKLTVSGDATVTATMTCATISKLSGSFKIDHPLKPKTHSLVHSFVESPQADNTYSGKLRLVKGQAELNLDEYFGMTEGTIVALNRDFRVFTTNESNWDNVKGKVKNNILYIESNNPESMAEVSWLVIGERQDKEIHESELTNDEGKIILEPSK